MAVTSNSSGTLITTPPMFLGINTLGTGNINIGTTTANTIGSTSTGGSITLNAVTNTGGIAGGIANTNTGTVAIANNNIGGITLTGGTTAIALGFNAIWNSAAATSLTINGNNIGSASAAITISTAVTTANTITGIYNSGACTALNIFGNAISNMTSAGTLYSLQGIFNNAGTTISMYQNNINTLTQTAATGAITVNAITLAGGTTTSIYKNKIYGITTASSGGSVNGLNITASTTVNIYNNVIGNLTATAASGLNVINGINAAASATYNVFFNNIVLNASSSAAIFGSSCIYFSSTVTSLNLRNNILINVSVPGTVASNLASNGITAVLRNTSGTGGTFPTIYATTSNKNLFWANPAGGTNNYLTYVEGLGTITNPMNTFANWKTFANQASPRDQASFAEQLGTTATNLSSLTLTGNTATSSTTGFLRIANGTSTQTESAGDVISSPSITDDYAGTTGNRATTPDVGAYEFTGTAVDLTAPSISYVSLSNSLCTSNVSLSATITDGSSVNTTTLTRPRLYYKKSTDANTFAGNTSANNGWKWVEATNTTSPFTFTTDFSLLQASVAGGDIIQYFVTAQDLAGTPNVGINSNTATFNAIPTSVALTSAAFPLGGTPNSYSVLSSIPTSVTIGAAGTYTSITGATASLFSAINAGGLSANTTATILDASVSETGATALNQISYGCSGSYTLTIKPNTGVTSVLTGSVASGALIRLNGADNVIFDGSNSGGTDRSLTITNTATTAPTGISIISLGSGAGATSNTIKNCNISTGVQTTTGYGISVGGSTPGTTGADNDNVTIQNNSISACVVSIFAQGTAITTSGGNDNLNITGNAITYSSNLASNVGINVNNSLSSTISSNSVSITTSATSGTSVGIQLGGTTGATVSQNTLSVSTAASTAPVGISLETNFVSSTVSRNTVTNVSATNTGGYGGRGITIGTGTASSALTIANNVIYGVNGSNWSSFGASSSAGIWIGTIGGSSTLTTTAGGVNLYYNSVNMSGSMGSGSTAALTAALYVGSGASALDIRNNVFVNTQVATSTTQKNYAVYSAAANTAFTTINYNDYFVSNSFNTASAIPGFLTSDQTTLTALQTAFGQNGNSISADPIFNSSTNLRPDLATSPVINTGVAIGAVTTDFLNTTRTGNTSIGAYETAIPAITSTSTGGVWNVGGTWIGGIVSYLF